MLLFHTSTKVSPECPVQEIPADGKIPAKVKNAGTFPESKKRECAWKFNNSGKISVRVSIRSENESKYIQRVKKYFVALDI